MARIRWPPTRRWSGPATALWRWIDVGAVRTRDRSVQRDDLVRYRELVRLVLLSIPVAEGRLLEHPNTERYLSGGDPFSPGEFAECRKQVLSIVETDHPS